MKPGSGRRSQPLMTDATNVTKREQRKTVSKLADDLRAAGLGAEDVMRICRCPHTRAHALVSGVVFSPSLEERELIKAFIAARLSR